MFRFSKFLRASLIGLGAAVLLGGCASNPLTSSSSSSNSSSITESASQQSSTSGQSLTEGSSSNQESATTTNYGGITKQDITQLAALNYQSGQSAIKQVNNGKSTLNPQSWQQNKVIYSNLDSLNRTPSPNTAFLEQRNKTNDSLRVQQVVQPTAWHFNHGGQQIYNRGHLIAYSVLELIKAVTITLIISQETRIIQRTSSPNRPFQTKRSKRFTRRKYGMLWRKVKRLSTRSHQSFAEMNSWLGGLTCRPSQLMGR